MLLVTGCSHPPRSNTEASYQTYCQGCHGEAGHPTAQQIASFRTRSFSALPKPNLSRIEERILSGAPQSGMPSFAGVFTKEELGRLARLVQSYYKKGN